MTCNYRECREPIEQPATGRPRMFCTDRHRAAENRAIAADRLAFCKAEAERLAAALRDAERVAA